MKLLVAGAREESLGSHVANVAENRGHEVTTCGHCEETLSYDATTATQIDVDAMFREHQFDSVVCTIGVNEFTDIMSPEWLERTEHAIAVNFLGPLKLLSSWLNTLYLPNYHASIPQFVVISSNSAHIARSPSLGYCASKAALSMAIRCAARDIANNTKLLEWTKHPPIIYGYEPGWIEGTPMSRQAAEAFETKPPHRIPGGYTLDAHDFAGLIVKNLEWVEGGWGMAMNGCMLRIDGGEQ